MQIMLKVNGMLQRITRRKIYIDLLSNHSLTNLRADYTVLGFRSLARQLSRASY